MKSIICLLLAYFAVGLELRENHDFWYVASKTTASSGIPYADFAWNYCDVKCVTFEHYYPQVDFYVITFKDSIYKPDFSACYAISATGTPQLWSKVASNAWY